MVGYPSDSLDSCYHLPVWTMCCVIKRASICSTLLSILKTCQTLRHWCRSVQVCLDTMALLHQCRSVWTPSYAGDTRSRNLYQKLVSGSSIYRLTVNSPHCLFAAVTNSPHVNLWASCPRALQF